MTVAASTQRPRRVLLCRAPKPVSRASSRRRCSRRRMSPHYLSTGLDSAIWNELASGVTSAHVRVFAACRERGLPGVLPERRLPRTRTASSRSACTARRARTRRVIGKVAPDPALRVVAGATSQAPGGIQGSHEQASEGDQTREQPRGIRSRRAGGRRRRERCSGWRGRIHWFAAGAGNGQRPMSYPKPKKTAEKAFAPFTARAQGAKMIGANGRTRTGTVLPTGT
jgi:hypothetical protein